MNREQREVLTEVMRMWFPLVSWSNYKTVGMGAFPILFSSVVQKNPQYFAEDFWKLPGYAGANPPDSLAKARVQIQAKVKKVIVAQASAAGRGRGPDDPRNGVDTAWQQLQGPPSGFQIDATPQGNLDLTTVKTGAAAGMSFPLGRVASDTIYVGSNTALMMSGGRALDPLSRVKPGDEVLIDNSDFLASQYYHRHQVPTPDLYVWDQFRGSDGKPIYP